jgi:probable DNA metabolism protein
MSGLVWGSDGSLEALLILVARSLKTGMYPDAVILPRAEQEGGSGELFAPPPAFFEASPEAEMLASPESSTESLVAPEFVRSASPRLYAATLRTWMSEEGVEADLLALAAAFSLRGDKAFDDYADPHVERLASALRRVAKETHLLEGFARFSLQKDGRYVAVLEPVANVLPALAPFFLGRFGNEAFALVDLRRRYAIASDPGEKPPCLTFHAEDEWAHLLPDGGDKEYAELWQRYFRVTENTLRHNPGLQRSLMPARYWSHLTEFGSLQTATAKE